MKYIIAILLVGSLGCRKKPQIIKQEDQVLVDSLYTTMIDTFRVQADTLCHQLRKELFDQAVDSIIQQRIREIEALQEG